MNQFLYNYSSLHEQGSALPTFILIFSLVFAIIEFLRGNILSGFPWNLVAYSWSWSTETIQFISLIGTYGFNLLSITIFSSPFIFFTKTKKLYKIKAFAILFFMICIIFSFGLKVSKNKIHTEIKNSKRFKKSSDLNV